MKVRINKVTLHSLLRELHEDAPTMESTVFVRYRGGQFGLMYHAEANSSSELLIMPDAAGAEYLGQRPTVDEAGVPHFEGDWVRMSEELLEKTGMVITVER